MTNITSNHDVPMVGQTTENMPDNHSLLDTTEKIVEVQVVDESLPTSQRVVDSRLASVDPRDANTPLRDDMRSKEAPHY